MPTIALPSGATAPAIGEALTAQPGTWGAYTPLTYQWYAE